MNGLKYKISIYFEMPLEYKLMMLSILFKSSLLIPFCGLPNTTNGDDFPLLSIPNFQRVFWTIDSLNNNNNNISQSTFHILLLDSSYGSQLHLPPPNLICIKVLCSIFHMPLSSVNDIILVVINQILSRPF